MDQKTHQALKRLAARLMTQGRKYPPALPAWVDHLPTDAQDELKCIVGALVTIGDLHGLEQALIEWKATADIHADPELLAKLTAAEKGVDL